MKYRLSDGYRVFFTGREVAVRKGNAILPVHWATQDDPISLGEDDRGVFVEFDDSAFSFTARVVADEDES